MKRLSSLFLSFLLTAGLFAQSVVIWPGVIIRANNAKAGDIYISDVSVDVRVTGNIASTTVDMIINNKSSSVLEGEFEFPLAENQYITGYALDMNNIMRKGVVVEKEKARVAFEDKVRQGIDPGLVEKTKGNNFKTRVYPLNPHGSRHIQITYEEEIPVYSDNRGMNRKYVLSPLVNNTLENFSFNMNVYNQQRKPLVSFGDSKVEVSDWNSGYNISYSAKNYKMKTSVVIELPQTALGNGIIAEDEGRNTYFYYYSPMNTKTEAKAPVKNLGVYWDVSASGANRDLAKELSLLKAYIASIVTEKVEVVLFANEVVDSKEFKAKDLAAIEKYIKAAVYDGATSFECLNFEKGKIGHDEAIVFSDGLVDWGNEEVKDSSIPVNSICSSASADFNFLKLLSRNSKGSFVNLLGTEENKALSILQNQSLRLISVEYNSADFGEVYPLPGTEITSDFSMSGLLKKRNGVIKLAFGYGNKITSNMTVEVSAVGNKVIWNDTDDKYVTRLWAQKKIEELSVAYSSNKDEIIDLSKKYKIVTKDTSLIVLETAADYAKYGIELPEDLKKDSSGYFAANNSVKESLKGDFEKVVRYFKEYKEWWNTKPGDFKKKAKKQRPGDGGILFGRAAAAPLDDAMPLVEERMSEPMSFNDSEMGMAADADMVVTSNSIRKASTNGASEGPTVNIQAWNPDAKYISDLKRVPVEKMYEKYLEIKKDYSTSPSFYMDVADYFWIEGLKTHAVRILSNLAELSLEDTDVLRALGNKLVEWGQTPDSIGIFKKLTVLKSEIPLFYRDLALAYERNGEYQKACDALYHIAEGKWDNRYDQIQQIAINDMNAIIALHKKAVNTSDYDSRILENFPVDVRIVLTWNTDNCDIDLWVTDPNGEKCFYSNKLTENGGRISRDFTQGYGPEEFCIKSAPKGKYKIQADYYGTHSQKILQPVVVQAEVYTNFGKENQRCEILTLQLESVKGNYEVGTITF